MNLSGTRIGPLELLMAAASVLAVAAVAVSLFAVWRARNLAASAEARARAGRVSEAAVAALRAELDALAAQLRDLEQQAPGGVPSFPPRAGLNLGRRSQVLRMHRRGESAAQIAAALEIPVQEVNLLLKVHHIVIGTL